MPIYVCNSNFGTQSYNQINFNKKKEIEIRNFKDTPAYVQLSSPKEVHQLALGHAQLRGPIGHSWTRNSNCTTAHNCDVSQPTTARFFSTQLRAFQRAFKLSSFQARTCEARYAPAHLRRVLDGFFP